MLSTGEFIIASGSAGDYLGALWSGVFVVICLGIASNVRDVAYRIHQFAVNHGPFAPGPGFSPTLLRILGGILGVAVFVEFAVSVRGIFQ